MGIRRLLAGLLAVSSIAFFGVAGAASANVPGSGWGFGIADDDAIGSATMPPDSINNARFDLLRPKIFRMQIYWNAVDDPNSSTDYIDKARKEIKRVRDAGGENVLVTFKRHDFVPTAAQYKEGIKKVVVALASDVDVWGAANEPNAGETWLGGTAGAQKLAEYNTKLTEVIASSDSTALRTSPDFVEPTFLSDLESYVNTYLAAGGTWGNAIAFHPYRGVNAEDFLGKPAPSLAGVEKLAQLSPGGQPIWITEVGAFGVGKLGSIEFNETPAEQDQRVQWMTGTLANYSRVARIYYYHMKGGSPSWDTALLNNDLTPRPAWYTWCKASHGGNASAPDCVPGSGSGAAGGGSGFSLSRGGGIVDIFARNSKNELVHKYYDPGIPGWTQWGSLGGSLTSDPSAITYGKGEIDVYARGSANQLVVRFFRPGTGWTAWYSLDGTLTSAPAAEYRGGGIVDVFARNSANELMHKYYDPAYPGGWTGWGNLGGSLTSDPSAITYGKGEIDVYARGSANQLVAKYFRPGTGWTGWYDLGGTLTSAPTAEYRGGGIVDIFARNSANELMHKYYDPAYPGGWTGWGNLGGQLAGNAPSAITYGKGEIDVYARDQSNQISLKALRPGTGWLPNWIPVDTIP